MSLSERQERQAIAMEADDQVGFQKRELEEIGQLTNLLYMALLPGAFGFFAILKAGLDGAAVESKSSMMRASDVVQKSKSAPLPSLSKGSKPTIMFRKPAQPKVNATTKIAFFKQQQNNRTDSKGEKIAFRASNDTARRGHNKSEEKKKRSNRFEPIVFRKDLKPQTNLATDTINSAQATLEKEKQGLTPFHFAPKPPRPIGVSL